MVIYYLLLTIAFIGLFIASLSDMKTREVPDWLNFSLVAIGLGIRAIYSALTFDYMFLVEGLLGLGLGIILGYIMFYAGQWGGGDSKMIMGLGAIIGLPLALMPFPLLLVFYVNLLFVGALYGIIYSIVLALLNKKKFKTSFRKAMHEPKFMTIRKVAFIAATILIISAIFFVKESAILWLCIALALLGYFSLYLVLFVKAVEGAAMYKTISVNKLTEGEWIAETYKDSKGKIVGPKDLGVTKEQIKRLLALKKSNKLKMVKIKVGIPFVPSFLISFIISIVFQAWWISL